jgi:hypothetical protein
VGVIFVGLKAHASTEKLETRTARVFAGAIWYSSRSRITGI